MPEERTVAKATRVGLLWGEAEDIPVMLEKKGEKGGG